MFQVGGHVSGGSENYEKPICSWQDRKSTGKDPMSRLSMVKDCLALRSSHKVRRTD